MTFSGLFTDCHMGLGTDAGRRETPAIHTRDGTDVGTAANIGASGPPQTEDVDTLVSDTTGGQEGREDQRRSSSLSVSGAARPSAVKVGQDVVDGLVSERTDLITKKFRAVLSAAEERRLKLLEWKLGRVEESEIGGALGGIESIVSHYEEFSRRVADWVEEVKAISPSPSKHRGGRLA